MSPWVALAGLCGLGVGLGLLLLVRAVRDRGAAASARQRNRHRREHQGRWLAAAIASGLVAGAFTGWVVGGVLAAMAVWSLPRLLGIGAADQRRVELVEGIAGWTEMLRDTLAAAAGLEQAVIATARTAPKPVRPHIQALAERLEHGERLAPALRQLADELEDPSADLVLAALVLAAEQQARQVAPLLGELAATARAQVEMRQRVDASRARTRTTLRVVVVTTLSFAGGLIVLNPAFLAPYDSLAGQFVLLCIGALFTLAFHWLRRMARLEEPERFLSLTEEDTEPAVGVGGPREGATS
ncbi:type II secretion system F family protein [Streptomyces sp. ODS28]|uniref:type II secretion system F family protein n=1 Tax=Streptomyces sp. ODS28 TaxID=3136688 RepID=UPI0031E76BB7